MKLAYTYTAKGALGDVTGVVFAEKAAYARASLKKMGLAPKAIRFSPIHTVFGSTSKGFDLAELEGFYRYFSRTEEKGSQRASSLADAINTVSDIRLKGAIAVMSEAIGGSGMNVSDAMRVAGFPERDCNLVANVENSVPIFKVLMSMSEELKREQDIKRNISKLLMMPKLIGGIGVCLMYVTVTFASPRIYGLFRDVLTSIELPAYALAYYKACDWIAANLIVSTVAYVGVIVMFLVGLRSDALKRVFEVLKPVRYARQKADYAALWGSFSLLIAAGVHLEEICQGLSKASRTHDARVCFARMGKLVREGRDIDDAAAAARFPLYIVNPVAAAQRSGALAEGTKDLSAKLIVDLDEFTNKATKWIEVGVLFMVTAFLLLFASVSVVPMLSAMFSAV